MPILEEVWRLGGVKKGPVGRRCGVGGYSTAYSCPKHGSMEIRPGGMLNEVDGTAGTMFRTEMCS